MRGSVAVSGPESRQLPNRIALLVNGARLKGAAMASQLVGQDSCSPHRLFGVVEVSSGPRSAVQDLWGQVCLISTFICTCSQGKGDLYTHFQEQYSSR